MKAAKSPAVDPVLAWALILALPTALLFGGLLNSETVGVGLLSYILLYFTAYFALAAKRKRLGRKIHISEQCDVKRSSSGDCGTPPNGEYESDTNRTL